MNENSSAKDRELQLAIDEAKRRQDLDIAVYQANTTRLLEAVRAGNKAGSDALRAVTLLNGGAAVALLAFIGHLASLQPHKKRSFRYGTRSLCLLPAHFSQFSQVP